MMGGTRQTRSCGSDCQTENYKVYTQKFIKLAVSIEAAKCMRRSLKKLRRWSRQRLIAIRQTAGQNDKIYAQSHKGLNIDKCLRKYSTLVEGLKIVTEVEALIGTDRHTAEYIHKQIQKGCDISKCLRAYITARS